MSDMRDIKVGDTVFVVRQSRRNDPERTSYTTTVARVGRKYAYLTASYGNELQFNPSNGYSSHGADSNARANGFGFDVYHSEEEYNAEQHEWRESSRLADRLTKKWGGLISLSPKVVASIHAILDEAGL